MKVLYTPDCHERFSRLFALDSFCHELTKYGEFDECVVDYLNGYGLAMFTFISKIGAKYTQYFPLLTLLEMTTETRSKVATGIVDRAARVRDGRYVYSTTKDILPDVPDPTLIQPTVS